MPATPPGAGEKEPPSNPERRKPTSIPAARPPESQRSGTGSRSSIAPSSAQNVRVGQILGGKYRVERVIGEGGMGVVVAAWHTELDQRVAIKFIHRDADQRFQAARRFRREARAAARIRSEHVARVFDAGALPDKTPFIVMEYLDGNTLSQELRARGQLPVQEAVDYVLQAIDALAEAHAYGIVHRDLKPANLFLARGADGSRAIKVLDFGISKSFDVKADEEIELTRGDVIIGSPHYTAPEQLSNASDIDVRVDIWSLGAILFKSLTLQAPFSAPSIPQLYAALLRDNPPKMSSLRAGVPARLEAAIVRCLQRDRQDRFATVGELAEALVEFASPRARQEAERIFRVLEATGKSGVLSAVEELVELASESLELVSDEESEPAGAADADHDAPVASNSADGASSAASSKREAVPEREAAVPEREAAVPERDGERKPVGPPTVPPPRVLRESAPSRVTLSARARESEPTNDPALVEESGDESSAPAASFDPRQLQPLSSSKKRVVYGAVAAVALLVPLSVSAFGDEERQVAEQSWARAAQALVNQSQVALLQVAKNSAADAPAAAGKSLEQGSSDSSDSLVTAEQGSSDDSSDTSRRKTKVRRQPRHREEKGSPGASEGAKSDGPSLSDFGGRL